VAHDLRHPAGYRWLVICTLTNGSGEWVLDGAADRAAAEARFKKWTLRGADEWPGEFQFRLAEATV
jgi:hypothetical protein